MNLKITVREIGRIAVLDLEGAVRLGASEEVFREQTERLASVGTLRVAVNLARVTDLDSSGIGLLVRTLSYFKQAGGICVFFAASQRVRAVLKMVRLEKILDVAEDEAAALSRFSRTGLSRF